ncbi:MAG TPA: hypothetical protein VFE17_13255 [Candidatus Baltobacteraceae bacterium]|jgi:hypothetical protein|nr:hypothetical protein [Candidatus Baltobacteraceae bacterium]
MQSSEDFGSTFGRAWQLLSENWIMIVPGIVIGIVAALVVWLLTVFGLATAVGFSTVGLGGAGVMSAFLSAVIIGVVLMLASILVIAYTTGMAGAAWRTGTATLDDGAQAFRQDGAQILVAIVLLFLIGIVAVALSLPTFGLALLAFYLFFLYTLPSVIVGGRSATEALAESARITAKNFLVTLGIVVLLGIAFFIAGWIAALVHGIPLLGMIIRQVIVQAVAVYATLVIVGEYIKLRAGVTPVGVGTPPAASPPPPTV